jgi:predicted amidohydrolase
MDLKVAIVQFDIVWEDTVANLSYLANIFSSIEKDTDLVVLPEMFHCGFSMTTERNAQKNGGEVLEWMKTMSNKHGLALMGSAAVELNEGMVNRLYVVDGDRCFSYDKRHLFTMGGEHLHYKQGVDRLIVELKGWRLCPLICYDLRFPVWSRNKGEEYDVLLYLANWPAIRIDVWDTLLKARAIENQSYVVGVNRIGKDKSLDYNGHSKVFDAKGKVMIDLEDNNVIAYVVLSKTDLQQFRVKFPVLNDADGFVLSFRR